MTSFLSASHRIEKPDTSGAYTINNVIGQGASTITYKTTYEDLSGQKSERILKEFYPASLRVSRESDGTIRCKPEDAEKYAERFQRFRDGGVLQNNLRQRAFLTNETPVQQGIFEMNNTCYLEVTPSEGRTFDRIGAFSMKERLQLCRTIAKLIHRYHQEGYLYLDLKPENIFVLTDSGGDVVKDLVMLIDFDSIVEKNQISFGKTLSFTEAWAAPEQINPYAFYQISEATDIYALGEMVFWSVFGRHSTVYEHRAFSSYPFDSTEESDEELKRRPVQYLLEKLFRKTLRSSVKNRFASMQDVVDLLDQIIEEYTKKEKLLVTELRPKEFFIGRKKELQQIDEHLKEKRLVFLHGIGGIGKSELAKQYAKIYAHEYNEILYWSYGGDLEKMICQDSYVTVSTVYRFKDESDSSYCERKLAAIKRCLKSNTLMIIDNLDCRIEDIGQEYQSKIWEFLLALPCEIIVTTRVKQENYKELQIEVCAFEERDTLRALYEHHCSYTEGQAVYVDDIIDRMCNHTLLVELIAKQTNASDRTPCEMLAELDRCGIYNLNGENVKLLKDGQSSCQTVMQHIDKLFAMSAISFEQKLMLAKVAMLPRQGITSRDFSAYFKIDNLDNLNWLIDYGWVNREEKSRILSVHPLVVEMIVHVMQKDEVLRKNFYEDAVKSLEWSQEKLSHWSYVQISRAIAENTMKYELDADDSAVYLLRNCGECSDYYSSSMQFQQRKYIVQVLEKCIDTKHRMELMVAHVGYVRCLELMESVDNAIEQCNKYIAKAKKDKNSDTIFIYDGVLADMQMRKLFAYSGKKGKQSFLYCVQYFYYLIKFGLGAFAFFTKEKLQYNKEESDEILETGIRGIYAGCLFRFAMCLEDLYDDTFFVNNYDEYAIRNIEKAIQMRKLAQKFIGEASLDNNVEIIIDEAKVLYMQHYYEEAFQKLSEIIAVFDQSKMFPSVPSCRIRQFFGNMAATQEKYTVAITELKRCIDDAQVLQISDCISAKLQLWRCINEVGDIRTSEKLCQEIMPIVQRLDAESTNKYLGDTLFNYATLYKMKGEYKTALDTYIDAVIEYAKHAKDKNLIFGIGLARCSKKNFEIYRQMGDEKQATEEWNQAREAYINCLGEDHPEVQEFLAMDPTSK